MWPGLYAFRHVSATVNVHDVNPNRSIASERSHYGAQRASGSSRASDNSSQVVWVDTNLEKFALTTTPVLGTHGYVIGVIYNPLDEVLECLGKHQASSEASSAGASGSAAAAAAFASDALALAFSASAAAAAIRSAAAVLAAFTFKVPS